MKYKLSPERIYLKMPPKDISENEEKHILRYNLAYLMAHGEILDLACGSGYGSVILSSRGRVTGVDRSKEAILFARKNNANENIRYILEDVDSYEPDIQFDTIVSLETFEHVSTYEGFDMLMNFSEWLNPNGQIILSTPMLRYKDGEPYITNPFHINEMPREDFIKELKYVLDGMELNFFHQDGKLFRVLDKENTGFLIVVARKHE